MNDSLHQTADLSNIIGFRQREMMRQNQLHALRLQIQQAEEAAKHAGKMEGHAARLQEIELQKLKVEQDRLTWQMEQEGLRGEKANELREMRKLLSRAIGSLEVYRDECPNPEAEAGTAPSQENIIKLTMYAAELEGLAIFLNARDPFHELGDIQALDKFCFSLANFVSALSASGEIKNEPFKFVRAALAQRLVFMREMCALIAECFRPAKRLREKPLLAFTNEEIMSIRMEAHNLRKELANSFQRFVQPLESAVATLPLDFFPHIIAPLEGLFADFAEYKQISAALQMNEEGMLECANGRGPIYSKVAAQLKEFTHLMSAHAAAIVQAQQELDAIHAQFSAGNYRTGLHLYENLPQGIEACPSYKERGFVDYESVSATASEWRNCLTDLEGKWTAARSMYLSRIESTKGLGGFWLAHRCEKDALVAQYMNELTSARKHILTNPECEYKTDALAFFAIMDSDLKGLRRLAKSVGRHQFYKGLFGKDGLLVGIMGLVAFIGIAWAIYKWGFWECLKFMFARK